MNISPTPFSKMMDGVLRSWYCLSTPVVQWLSYSPLDRRFVGSIPAEVDVFLEHKNPEYYFLRDGIKAVCPES